MVSAYEYFDKLFIYDIYGELLRQVGDVEKKLVVNSNIDDGLINYYMDVNTSDKYIYTLYYHQLDKDYGEILQPTFIRVYDWDGNLLKGFEIPEYLMSFCVDEKNGFLYGLSYFESVIKKYKVNPNSEAYQ